MILLVDNYDSFTYNLFQLLSVLKAEVQVRRNDEITPEEVRALDPDGIVISPGPGDPSEAGVSCDLLSGYRVPGTPWVGWGGAGRGVGAETPILGVCLGHQCVGAAFGARVVRSGKVMHGKTSRVFHTGASVFSGLPSPFEAVRYHSLIVDRDSVPDCLEITAEADDGAIMGLRHREYPIHGVQFHPESILTREGPRLVQNFLDICAAHRNTPIG